MIGLVFATLLEADPFIKGFSLKDCEREPFAVYRNETFRLIISGIGKANAAMACAYIIRKYHPSCICNLGAAGATDKTFILGESYHITKVIEPDRPQLKTGLFHEHSPHVLSGFHQAILATQDRPVNNPEEKREIALLAQLVDMEGASVVQAAGLYQTTCYLFKFVSDTSDHCQSNDIVNNIEIYRESFYRFFRNEVLPGLTLR